MTEPALVYYTDQELPSPGLNWYDNSDPARLIDFSTGWTFTVKIAAASAPNTVLVTKTTGITGSAGSSTTPNVVIDWSTTDWSTLTPAAAGSDYLMTVYARRNADSKDRVYRPGRPIALRIIPAAT